MRFAAEITSWDVRGVMFIYWCDWSYRIVDPLWFEHAIQFAKVKWFAIYSNACEVNSDTHANSFISAAIYKYSNASLLSLRVQRAEKRLYYFTVAVNVSCFRLLNWLCEGWLYATTSIVKCLQSKYSETAITANTTVLSFEFFYSVVLYLLNHWPSLGWPY